jgi:multisubunit Na+/H+ antiporter MnhF subunit
MQTKTIGAILAGLAVPVLGLLAAFDAIDWNTGETGAVVALWLSTVAFVMAIVAHFRPDTPSRWVAILNLIGPETVAILGVLMVFHVIDDVQNAAILAVVAVPLGILGVAISQDKVTSPETLKADVNTAQAVALRGPMAGDVLPPAA